MISKVKPVVDDTGERHEWFETWFDSPYYHILYSYRDHREAEVFLDELIEYLSPAEDARILDAACGKGRHSIFLNRKGFDVTGFDLSEESINYVKQFENDRLHFYLHDMREIFRVNYFDIVLNLFSSFGYFQKERDNIRCLITNSRALKKDGRLVLDYFNPVPVIRKGNVQSVKTVDGIDFHIRKTITGDAVIKDIEFTDRGKQYKFQEHLVLAGKDKLIPWLDQAGLEVADSFGSYSLSPYVADESERLILIARKR